MENVFLIIIIIAVFIVILFKIAKNAKKVLYCSNCGYQGKPKVFVKGSLAVEIVLWILFILPGIIYSVWRSFSRYNGCPECNSNNMIPVNSPRAITEMKKLSTKYPMEN